MESWQGVTSKMEWIHPVSTLYRGQYWTVIRDLQKTLNTKLLSQRLLVASAGFGLLDQDDLLPNYAATFQSGGEDSVFPETEDARYRRQWIRNWWDGINSAFAGRKRYSALQQALGPEPTIVLVLLSTFYLEALHREIRALQQQRANIQFLIYASSKDPARTGLDGSIILNSSLQKQLGGNRGSLAARMALAYFRSKRSMETISAGDCRQFLKRFQKHEEVMVWPSRQAIDDEHVRGFIKKSIASGAKAYTPVLRQLRDSGYACEMKRFKALFNQEAIHGKI
jgi:hypothetical protein